MSSKEILEPAESVVSKGRSEIEGSRMDLSFDFAEKQRNEVLMHLAALEEDQTDYHQAFAEAAACP